MSRHYVFRCRVVSLPSIRTARLGVYVLKIMRILVLVCLLVTWGAVESTTAANMEMDSIVSRFWDWRVESSPYMATRYSLDVNQDCLDEYSEEFFAEQRADAWVFLNQVQEVDRSKLDKQNQINGDLLIILLETFIEGYDYRKFGMYNYPNVMENPLSALRSAVGRMKLEVEKDYLNLLARYRALPRQIDQIIALMTKAIAEHTTRHEVTMKHFVDEVDKEIKTLEENVTTSSLYLPFSSIADTIPSAVRFNLTMEAKEILRSAVVGTWKKMQVFLQDQYMPHTAGVHGVGALPGGMDYYQKVLKWYISVDMTPEEVHNKGLEEVDRIQKLMAQEMVRDGFTGTLQDYIAHLRADTSNFHQTEDAMLEGYRDIVQVVDAKLPQVLLKTTQAAVRVVKTSSRNSPSGSYSGPSADGTKPGTFYANVFDPETKPKFSMASLTLHEVEPGHHSQVAYHIGDQSIPAFRREFDYKYFAAPFAWLLHNVYSEGWALYAESLGEEMKVYTEPHTLFGRYVSEIFRAVRLVVDTGIHAKGWTMTRAVDYMANYTTTPRSHIEFEMTRYISWPGQACSYKIGELRIKELRKRAEEKLGSSFDLREFNDEVLQVGRVPLSLLEPHIDDWIARTVISAGSRTTGSTPVGAVLALLTICFRFMRFKYI